MIERFTVQAIELVESIRNVACDRKEPPTLPQHLRIETHKLFAQAHVELCVPEVAKLGAA